MNLTRRYSTLSNFSKRLLPAHGIGVILFLLIQLLPAFSPGIRLRGFSEPAARVAAVFLGTPLRVEMDSIALAHPLIHVAVTEACSGFDFFSLLIALLIGLSIFKQGVKKTLRESLFIFISAYGLTLLGNTSRIVCAVQIKVGTAGFLSSSFDAIIHQSIGVIVFVTILSVTWNLLTRLYDRKRTN